MKFSIEQATLKNALARMNSMVGAKDIQAGIITLDADEFGGVSIRRTSFLGQTKIEIGGVVNDGGTSSVNYEVFSNIVSRLNTEFIDFHQEPGTLHISGGRAKVKIGEYKPDEVPPVMGDIPADPIFKIDSKTLETALAIAMPAMDTGKGRPELAGVGFRRMAGSLICYATNSSRLHSCTICKHDAPIAEGGTDAFDPGCFIPSEAAASLGKILSGSACLVSVYISERKAVFSSASFEVQAPLNDKAPANFQGLIDLFEYRQKVKLPRQQAMSAATCAAGISREHRNPVVLQCDDGKIRITSKGQMNASDYSEDIEGESTGDFRIKFNAAFFSDMLKCHPGEMIEIEIGDRLMQIRTPGIYTMQAYMIEG